MTKRYFFSTLTGKIAATALAMFALLGCDDAPQSLAPAALPQESDTPRATANSVTAGKYKVMLFGERLQLRWNNQILVDDMMALLVAKNWDKIYANETYLTELKTEEFKISGNQLSLTRNREKTNFDLAISVDAQKGFDISLQYHTPHTERLEMEQFFFLLPQETFEKAFYYSDDTLKRLPPKIGFDPNRDSRERMCENSKKISIFRDFGTVNFTSSVPLFTYDARYHIWKGETQRSFAVLTDQMPDNQKVQVQIQVAAHEPLLPIAENLQNMPQMANVSDPAVRHIAWGDASAMALDLPEGQNTLTLSDANAPANSVAAVLLLESGKGEETPRIVPGDAQGHVTFDLTGNVGEIAFGNWDLTTQKMNYATQAVAVAPMAPAHRALQLLEALQQMPSAKLDATRARLAELLQQANTKLDVKAFAALSAELDQIGKLVDKLKILEANQLLDKALEQDFFLYQTDSTSKVYDRADLPADLVVNNALPLSGCRNEFLNFQVTAVTLFEPLQKAQVAEFRLYDQAGKLVADVPSKIFTVEEVISGADIVPDLLSKATELTIPTEQNSRTWWINFQIPANLPPGDYRTEVAFSGNGQSENRLQNTLHVYDFALEDEFDAVAIVGYFPHELRALPDYKVEMEDQLAEELVQHGFYPNRGLSHPRYMDEFDYALEPTAERNIRKFHYYTLAGIPYVDWLEKFYTNGKLPSGDAYREMVVQHMLDNAEQLKKDGLLDYTFAYYDEVEKNDQRVLDFIRSVRDKSGVKFATAFHKAAFGTDYVEFYANDVDLFYFSSAFLERGYWVDYMKELKGRGKKLGIYFNIVYPKQPTCNVIDAPALAHRTLFWTQWKYDIDYNLFWGINCWWANLKMDADPQSVNNRGDGNLLYPDLRGGGYALSLRLEIMREGVQDYRYLRRVKELLTTLQSRPELAQTNAALVDEAETLLTIPWLKDSCDVPLDASLLLGQRQQAATLIENMQKILNQ